MTLLLLLLLASCASPRYLFVAADHQAANGRQLEAVYAEPATHPSGKVRVAALGIDDIQRRDETKSVPAIHVRVSVSNQSDKLTWLLPLADQFASFPNHAQVKGIPINSGVASNAVLEVKPGELRTVDLYFPLPGGSADDLPEFDLHWHLQAGNDTIREATLFDRVPAQQIAGYPYYYDPYSYPPGWGWGWGAWRGPVVHYELRN